MQVTPYLNFNGRCEEALEFYKKTAGADVQMLMRFKEAPAQECDDSKPNSETENKIMHASFRIGESAVMASDGYCTGAKTNFEGISLALDVKTEPEADRLFKALSTGGQVQVPLTKTFFSPAFGIVTDPFGVSWMIVVEEKK